MNNKIFNIVLLITIIGEFLIPWILKHFYKSYNSKLMVMSVLGSPESPVKNIYNLWLIWLGIFLLFSSALFFNEIKQFSKVLAILTFFSITLFALGAGILSGIFSVNETKEKVTFSSKIHGVGSAIGFMALMFFPLLQSLCSFRSHDIIKGVVCVISFVISFLFFVFFIMGDKEEFKKTFFCYSGIWERLSLFFMYVPFLYHSIKNIFCI